MFVDVRELILYHNVEVDKSHPQFHHENELRNGLNYYVRNRHNYGDHDHDGLDVLNDGQYQHG